MDSMLLSLVHSVNTIQFCKSRAINSKVNPDFFETWIDFYTLAWQKIQLVLNLAHLWWNETLKYIWSAIFVLSGSFEKCWQRSRKRRDTLKKYFFYLQSPIDFKVVKGQIFWSSNNLWSFLSCFIYRQNGRTHTAWIWIWMAKRPGVTYDTLQAC